MKKNLVIINNEKCTKKEGNFFCENIEVSSINEILGKKFNIKLILRKSIINPVHKINNKNVVISSNIFLFIKNVVNSALRDNARYLIISVTPYTFISFLFLFLFRRKIFLYLRSDGQKEIAVIFGKTISIIYKVAENLMVKFCNLIVVNNLIAKKKFFNLVNPSQIDEDWFESTKKSERKQIRLLYVGRLKIEKGVNSLIDIFSKIKFIEKEVFLTLVGQGNIQKDTNEKIRFIEPTSIKKDLIKHYDENDIFILPSYTEGQPQVLIESLIRQRPVIVFRDIEHVAQDYEGVFVIDRNPKDLLDIIKFIDKNYNQILEKMKKNKYPTKKIFLNQLDVILNQS